jgi:hypothetical protein
MFTGSVNAQSPDSEKAMGPPGTICEYSYTPVYQFETDMDDRGRFDVQRHFLRFNITRPISPQWIIGLGLSLDYERWNFSDIGELTGVELWDEIVRPGISASIIYNTDNGWRLMFIPSLGSAGATGAKISESLSYGTVLAAMHSFRPNLMIGFGAAVSRSLDEWAVSPYLAIDWTINDWFKMGNPFQAGLAGPAGLALTFTPTDDWEISAGGAYRSYRFRLDDSAIVTDGIGDVDSYVAFLRIGRKLGKHYRMDVNAGALFNGSITINDEDFNELGKTDYDTAPFVGFTIKGDF